MVEMVSMFALRVQNKTMDVEAKYCYNGSHCFKCQEKWQPAHLGSAIISCILSLVIFGTLRFYADWFISTQLTILFGGFVSSFIFLFSLTSLSNFEMLLFGDDFACKFIPEVLVCLLLSVLSASVVHRVCATTCIIFSILALYFVDRISNECYHKTSTIPEAIQHRKGGSKKNK